MEKEMGKVHVTCHYRKSGQSACMFCISHGIQWRQDRRYIADIAYHMYKESRATDDPAHFHIYPEDTT